MVGSWISRWDSKHVRRVRPRRRDILTRATITTDLERHALLDGPVVGRQLRADRGVERDDQLREVATRARALDRRARRMLYIERCLGERTRGKR